MIKILDLYIRAIPRGDRLQVYSLVQCESCGNERAIVKKLALKKQNHRCKSCAFSGENSHRFGKASPMKGKTHSLESRLKISRGNKGKRRTEEQKNNLKNTALRGEKNPRWNHQCKPEDRIYGKPGVRIICAECGQSFVITKNNFRNGAERCVSCRMIPRRGKKVSPEIVEKISGENHYKWNPSLTNEERIRMSQGRDGQKDNELRKKCFERDGFRCVLSGINGRGNLRHHHLNGYNWDIENRYNLDNVVTLIVPVHDLFHSIYGYGDNTKEQFEEFTDFYLTCGKRATKENWSKWKALTRI